MEEEIDGNKDYIVSILDEMSEEELDEFDVRFRLIDKREILSHIIKRLDEGNENDMDKLSSIYTYMRDSYWSDN